MSTPTTCSASNRRLCTAVVLLTLFTSGCHWIQLASTNSAGEVADGSSYNPAISNNGRYVVFQSAADNLDGFSQYGDVLVRDMLLGTTAKVSVHSGGNPGNGYSSGATISDSGRYIAFESVSDNLVDVDTNTAKDVFVHDRVTGVTSLVSLNIVDRQGIADSFAAVLSGDGRYVAFQSEAPNMVNLDLNWRADIFVRDIVAGTIERVSVHSNGTEGDDYSRNPDISADGRYVTFGTWATNLLDGVNSSGQILLHDRTTGETSLVSQDSAGNPGNFASYYPKISADGNFIAYESTATNLVPDGTPFGHHLYVYDRVNGTTTRANIDSQGNPSEGATGVELSADGRLVSFYTAADNIVTGDTNGVADVFVHDRSTGHTRRVSLDGNGAEADAGSHWPAISHNGRYIAFTSDATNLVADAITPLSRNVFVRALPHLTVDDISPAHVPIGHTTSLTVSGTGFVAGTVVGFTGGKHTIANMLIVDENTITLDITVAPDANAGSQDAISFLGGTSSGYPSGVLHTCEACITYF